MINYSENKAEMRIRSHRYDINRPRNGHKYTEYKVCFSMMIVMCIK